MSHEHPHCTDRDISLFLSDKCPYCKGLWVNALNVNVKIELGLEASRLKARGSVFIQRAPWMEKATRGTFLHTLLIGNYRQRPLCGTDVGGSESRHFLQEGKS